MRDTSETPGSTSFDVHSLDDRVSLHKVYSGMAPDPFQRVLAELASISGEVANGEVMGDLIDYIAEQAALCELARLVADPVLEAIQMEGQMVRLAGLEDDDVAVLDDVGVNTIIIAHRRHVAAISKHVGRGIDWTEVVAGVAYRSQGRGDDDPG